MITLSNVIPIEDKDGECVAQQAHGAHHRYQSFLQNMFGPLHQSKLVLLTLAILTDVHYLDIWNMLK